jgi:hypothetical protein
MDTPDIIRIFPTWESYTDAVQESLTTEFFFEKFPDYGIVGYTYDKADIVIVKTLLAAGYNPQNGLDSFLNACINGPRYLKDMTYNDILSGVLELFMKHGAKITDTFVAKLFSKKYPAGGDFEDEACFTAAKGILIDFLAPYGIDATPYGDWPSITAQYWEDIPEETDYDTKFKMCLKESSEYLQSL